MEAKDIFSWITRIIIAFILWQTLFFKLTSSSESVYIFEMIGLEPLGRYSSAMVELLADILILIPKTRIWGTLLALGAMMGALFFHLTTLGIEVQGDRGGLFSTAIFTFALSLVSLFLHKNELPFLSILPPDKYMNASN